MRKPAVGTCSAIVILTLGLFMLVCGCAGDSGNSGDSDSDQTPPTLDDDGDPGADDDQADDDGVPDDDLDDDINDDDLDDDLDDDDLDDDVIDPSCDATGIVRLPYLQDVRTNSIKILWATDLRGDAVVEYGKTEALGTLAESGDFGLIHAVSVEGLETESLYFYRVSSCGIQGDIYTFATAPYRDTPFTFVAYGDNRSDPDSHRMVAEGILNAAPDFVLNTGDIVADGWVFSQYDEQYFNPARELMTTTPTYVAIGNHEGESPFFYSLFRFGGNGGHFAFSYGNTYFIALNTNRLYIQGSPQYLWFEERLGSQEAENAEWIVVFAHHPAWSEGWDSPGYDGEILMRFSVVPLMEQYGVDLFFAGHTHDYERGEMNGVTHIITGGGGSALDTFQQDFDHIVISEFRYHFVNISVAGNTLHLEGTDPDGTVFDEITLTHN